MSKTLIILNPHAGSGRAGRVWKELEPLLWEQLGELVVAVTQRTEEVAEHLDKAHASGLTRVISIGGDGTNHTLVNALADLNERYPDGQQMIYPSALAVIGRALRKSRWTSTKPLVGLQPPSPPPPMSDCSPSGINVSTSSTSPAAASVEKLTAA